MTTNTDRAALLAENIASMEAHRDKLIHALDANDASMVLGWDNGLVMCRNDKDGDFVGGIFAAAPADAFHGVTVKNGNGEIAIRRRRQAVIAATLESVLESIEMLKGLPTA